MKETLISTDCKGKFQRIIFSQKPLQLRFEIFLLKKGKLFISALQIKSFVKTVINLMVR